MHEKKKEHRRAPVRPYTRPRQGRRQGRLAGPKCAVKVTPANDGKSTFVIKNAVRDNPVTFEVKAQVMTRRLFREARGFKRLFGGPVSRFARRTSIPPRFSVPYRFQYGFLLFVGSSEGRGHTQCNSSRPRSWPPVHDIENPWKQSRIDSEMAAKPGSVG